MIIDVTPSFSEPISIYDRPYYIYVLSDETGIRYVGQTVDPPRNSGGDNIVARLLEAGTKPKKGNGLWKRGFLAKKSL